MLVIVGASASGKTEIANTLVKQFEYVKSVTTTTRKQRQDELNGVHYHFVSKEVFQNKIMQHAFVETTQYQDHAYGLQKDEIGSNRVIILDPSGSNALYHLYPKETCVIYIQSDQEMRQTRMLSRGDDINLIYRRLSEDNKTFQLKNLHCIHLIIDNHHQTIASIADEIHQYYQTFKKK